jgi:hypothetical protein
VKLDLERNRIAGTQAPLGKPILQGRSGAKPEHEVRRCQFDYTIRTGKDPSGVQLPLT